MRFNGEQVVEINAGNKSAGAVDFQAIVRETDGDTIEEGVVTVTKGVDQCFSKGSLGKGWNCNANEILRDFDFRIAGSEPIKKSVKASEQRQFDFFVCQYFCSAEVLKDGSAPGTSRRILVFFR